MELNKKLSQIQAKLKAKKSKFNSFGKYNYRSAEDILEALKPYLIEHNVTVIINESIEEHAGLLIMNSVATISDGDTEIQAVALVAVDKLIDSVDHSQVIDFM
jgi:signal recognition particle GTPase